MTVSDTRTLETDSGGALVEEMLLPLAERLVKERLAELEAGAGGDSGSPGD